MKKSLLGLILVGMVAVSATGCESIAEALCELDDCTVTSN